MSNTKEYNRCWYLKNRVDRIAQNRKQRQKKRVFIHEILLSNPCLCGEDNVACLEFDHVGEKTENISSVANRGWSVKRILSEMRQCQILCSNCHRKRTSEQMGWYQY